MIEPLRHQLLGLSGPRLRQAFFGFKPIADYLKTSLRNLQAAEPRSIARWTQDTSHATLPAGAIRVRLEEISGVTEGASPIDAFFDDDVRFVSDGWTANGRSRRIRVLERDRDASTLDLESSPAESLLVIPPNTYILECQQRAMRRLQQEPHRAHVPLIELVLPFEPSRWPEVHPADVASWHVLTDESRPGTDEQRQFVRTALGTPDFALLEGPPGSGKTTAICELILQAVARGERVLLCASTHVAVDNVLERVALDHSLADQPVVPVRVGDRYRCSPQLRHLLLEEQVRTERRRILDHLLLQPAPTYAQELLRQAVESDQSTVQDLVLDASNLVCGTTIGILQHPTIKNRRSGATDPIFDLMIVDEASKTTLQEFLVPAVLAKRWILVGDIRQLSPYADQTDLAANLMPALRQANASGVGPDVDELVRTEISADEVLDQDDESFVRAWADALAWRLITLHQYRMGDAPDRLRGDVEALTPRRSTREIEAMADVALPSVLESLQKGVGGRRDPRVSSVLGCGLPDAVLGSRQVMLTHQYRMHPEISAFPRTHIYAGKALNDAPGLEVARDWAYDRYAHRIAWVDTRPAPGLEHQAGREEATQVVRELQAFLQWARPLPPGPAWEVAVLSFYRDQVRELRKALAPVVGRDHASSSTMTIGDGHGPPITITLGTVDTFQGREADLVLLSIGKQRLTHFTRSPNRVNVAITRARYQLVVVGNRQRIRADRAGGVLGELAENAPDSIAWQPTA